MAPVHKLTTMGSLTSNKVDFPSMTAGYGDFGAMQRIASTTLASGQVAITFSNIPQIYQDLFLICSIRRTSATLAQGYVYTNHSTYSQTFLKGNGSVATSSRYTGGVGVYFGLDALSNATSTFTTATTHFLNYANTTTFKTALLRCANDLNGSGTVELSSGLLQGTAAVTTVGLAIQGGDLITAGSTATLYGIKSSAA